uniref:3FTx-Asp-1 n=1 Tax=Aspidites melanocephalus TaxID=51883 RepID=M9T1L2_ASPME
MKAWLLALVVVALVGTDPGHTLTCCTSVFCNPKECAEGQDSCITVHTMGLKVIQQCAQNCTYPGPYKKICCCTDNNCNTLV